MLQIARLTLIGASLILALYGAFPTFSQEFGPEPRNSYIVKFIDPSGPSPEIGGVFDLGWKATFNESPKWLIYSDPENDQDPVNGPRSDDFYFYAGIRNGTPPRLFVAINGKGFTPAASADAPAENDAAA